MCSRNERYRLHLRVNALAHRKSQRFIRSPGDPRQQLRAIIVGADCNYDIHLRIVDGMNADHA